MRDREPLEVVRALDEEERPRELPELLRFRVEPLLEVERDFFFGGTFAPFRRASDNPIAIACLALPTLRPDLPD